MMYSVTTSHNTTQPHQQQQQQQHQHQHHTSSYHYQQDSHHLPPQQQQQQQMQEVPQHPHLNQRRFSNSHNMMHSFPPNKQQQQQHNTYSSPAGNIFHQQPPPPQYLQQHQHATHQQQQQPYTGGGDAPTINHNAYNEQQLPPHPTHAGEGGDLTSKIADKLLAFQTHVPLRRPSPVMPTTTGNTSTQQGHSFWSQQLSNSGYSSSGHHLHNNSSAIHYGPHHYPSPPPPTHQQLHQQHYQQEFVEHDSDSRDGDDDDYLQHDDEEEEEEDEEDTSTNKQPVEKVKRQRSNSSANKSGSNTSRKKKSRADRDKQITTDPCVICKQFCPKRCYQSHHYLEDYKTVFPSYDGSLGKVCPGCYYKCYAYRQSRTRKQSIDKSNTAISSRNSAPTSTTTMSTVGITPMRGKGVKRERYSSDESLDGCSTGSRSSSPSVLSDEPKSKRSRDELVERLRAALEEKDIVIQFLRHEIAVTKEKLEQALAGIAPSSSATNAPVVASCASQPFGNGNNFAALSTL